MKVKIVVADFSGDASLSFYKNILDEVEVLDVSIVIANAGVLLIGPVEEMKLSRQCGMIDVNMYHYVMMHKVFLPKLLSRTKRGERAALIGVSSAYYLRYFATGMTVYSGTKGLATCISRGLKQEFDDIGDRELSDGSRPSLIDLQCQCLSGTKTNIVQHWGMNILTPVEAVTEACLRDLGQHNIVYGTMKNEIEVKFILSFFAMNFPTFFDFAISKASLLIPS